MKGVEIHRAPWVFVGMGPPVADGAVVVSHDRILESGRAQDMRKKFGNASVRLWDHEEAALVPGAVNAHTHLDFSLLSLSRPSQPMGFPQWLVSVFQAKENLSPSKRRDAHKTGSLQAFQSGTRCFANVMNPPVESFPEPSKIPHEHRFVELLGFHCQNLHELFSPEAITHKPYTFLAAHSLYATSWKVIAQAKAWSRSRGLLFSIHAAEHSDEVHFVRDGTGFCRDLLQSLGRWDASWRPSGTSPVKTLQTLGVLDAQTLLVHMVHVNEEDWNVVARCGAAVCFCPRSNAWIEGTIPRIEAALQRGIRCALGTDSLASNEDLNLFREATAVLDGMPGITPATVLRMVTSIGAQALGLHPFFGHLGPGAKTPFLAVSVSGSFSTENDLAERIIRHAAQGSMVWVADTTSH
ncbi:MAG: amidohydrolase family protein [Desulfosoma sp.]